MRDELLKIDEVAKTLGVARSTIYSWVKKGIFPEAGKLGPKLRRWRLDEIEQWQRENRLTQSADH